MAGEVLGLPDSLDFGPVRDVTGAERAAWLWQFFKEVGSDKTAADLENDWAEVLSYWQSIIVFPDQLRIWFTRRSVHELCGFMELLHRLPSDRMIETVDLTTALLNIGKATESGQSFLTPALGVLNDEQLEQGLAFVQQHRVGDFTTDSLLWKSLKSENAELRTLSEGRIVSASADYYDAVILEHVAGDWKKVAHLVGELLWKLNEEHYLVNGHLMFSRIQVLARQGLIELAGEEVLPRKLVRLRTV